MKTPLLISRSRDALLSVLLSRTLTKVLVLIWPLALFAFPALGQRASSAALASGGRWQPGWSRWANNPTYVPLQIKPSAKAQEGTLFTIVAGTATATNFGAGCTVFTNTPEIEVMVRPNQPLVLSMSGSNVSSTYIELVPPPSMDLRPALMRSRGNRRPTTPANFRSFVDGVETNIINHAGTNNCGAYVKTWFIEVRPFSDALRRNPGSTDGTILPENEAPGDALWPEIGPAKDPAPEIANIRWSVGLGRLYSGMSAGRICYSEQGFISYSYTPYALFFDAPFTNHTQVQILTDASITNAKVLRQIRAPQAFVDIPSNTTNYFELRFYQLSQISTNTNSVTGYYDILTNAPFVLWRFSNPDDNPLITRRLRIAEERPGMTYTNDIEFDPTNLVWSLVRGVGSEAYRETRSLKIETNVVWIDFEDITNYCRFETNRVADGAGRVAYEALEKYETSDWDWELTSSIADPRTNALATTFEYYAGTPRRLKRTIHPDGLWEVRGYEADMLQAVQRPIGDIAADADLTTENTGLTTYTYDRIWETGELFVYHTRRTATNGTYRFDTTRKTPVYDDTTYNPNLIRETYQIGWLPDCMSARVRDGALRYLEDAPAEACGHMAMTLTNYTLGVTNTFAFGAWSNSTFFPGPGNDWCKTSVFGLGSLFDPEDSIDYAKDRLQTIPGKSAQSMEIRRDTVVLCREFYCYSDSVTNGTNFSLVFRDFYTNDVLGHSIGQRRLDAQSSNERTLRTADWQGTNQFPGPLLLSESDEDGLIRRYTYDSLKRLKSTTLVGTNGLPDYVISFAYDACGRPLSVITNAGSLSLSNSFVYDLSGRLLKTTDHNGMETSYSYADGGRTVTTTYPGGATLINARFISGEPKSETGTAVVPRYFEYQYNHVDELAAITVQKHTNAITRTTFLGSLNSSRKTITAYNLWEQPAWDVVFGYEGTTTNRYFYANHDEDLTSTEKPALDPYFAIQNYSAYDSEHHGYASWLFRNGAHDHFQRDLPPAPFSDDRLATTYAYYTNISGAWFRVTNAYTYLSNWNSTATFVSSARQRLNGLGSNIKSELTLIDADSNAVITTISVDRAARKVTSSTTISASVQPASTVTINGLLQSETTFSISKPTLYEYDALRRPIRITNPLGATTTTTYDPANGRVAATTDFTGNTTTYSYYGNTHTNAGRVSCITAANSKKSYYAYNFRGDLLKTWGDVPYPEERIYSDFGELVELRTYRGGSGWNGSSWPASPGAADVTTWVYDSDHNGLLTSKIDSLGRGVSYSYNTNNELLTRTWARGVTTTNIYFWGDLIRIDYSDGTPSVTFTNFNRSAGQPTRIIDAAGERTLTYDHADRLVSDTSVNGIFSGISVSNHFNATYGRDMIKITGLSSSIQHDYTYDDYGRLGNVASGVYSSTYAYAPNSDLLRATTNKNNGTPVLTTTRVWDHAYRLQSIANIVSGATITSHNYLYDSMHRRSQATLEDGSLWKYGYNDRNELTSGKRYWSDWVAVAGQQFEYAFDNIGNRTSAKAGGDASGNGLRSGTYGANSLNQYTNRTVPGTVDIVGAASATATNVSVNSQACYRKGEYYWKDLVVANGSGPIFPSLTNSATQNGTTTNVIGNLLIAPATQTFSYDLDGNLTNDSVWSYSWDAENRLTQMTNLTTVSTSARKKLVFGYDYLGRRVTKKVYPWSGSAYSTTPETDLLFLYDGWNLIAELNATNGAPIRSYMWGQDLSGTMNRAGGISGLLLVAELFVAPTNHFVGYDANGNIVALINAGNNSTSARYEYSPFGEAIRLTGPLAKVSAFRWSTKYVDDESGIVVYPRRFYSPGLGRWLSRDPIDEEGSRNLYLFVSNNALSFVDPNGDIEWSSVKYWWDVAKAIAAAVGALFGHEPAEGGRSVRGQLEENIRTAEETVDSGAETGRGGGDGKNKRRPGYQFAGNYEEAKEKLRGSPKLKALAAIGTIYYLASGAADTDAQSFAANFRDYHKHLSEGDQAMADLDAASLAADAQNLFQHEAVALNIWSSLPE